MFKVYNQKSKSHKLSKTHYSAIKENEKKLDSKQYIFRVCFSPHFFILNPSILVTVLKIRLKFQIDLVPLKTVKMIAIESMNTPISPTSVKMSLTCVGGMIIISTWRSSNIDCLFICNQTFTFLYRNHTNGMLMQNFY